MTHSPDPVAIDTVPVSVETSAPTGTTNAYLADGVLVDPAAKTPELDRLTAANTVHAIAVTHTHPDHVGGVRAYAQRTGAPVFAHAAHVDRFASATGVNPDGTFRDGESVAGRRIRALDTPGHASDHVAFAVDRFHDSTTDSLTDARSSVALCGDLAVADGSVVVGGADADLAAYLDSLRRLRDAGYDRLYPGHGPVIDEPVAACQRLIDHRLAREKSVLDAVENGAESVDAVVAAAYEKDLTGVEDLARATVRAHLEKLVAEGRIADSWTRQ